MKFRIEKVDDTDAARDMHKLAFGGDKWPGDDHEFWIAKDRHGAVVGFASATLINARAAFLSRAAVARSARGQGLHRKLIEARLRWAWDQDCTIIVTHVENHNYESIINLQRAGFRFAPNNWLRGWSRFHLMYHEVYSPTPEAEIKIALSGMDN